MLKILHFCLITCLIGSTAIADSAELGKVAPTFTATATNGSHISIPNAGDDIIVLEWSNPECPFVKKFYDGNHMQTLQQNYTQNGVKWLRIVSSAPGKQGHAATAEEANATIAEKHIAATATILDESGEIGKLYGAKTTPHIFIIHKGVLVYKGAMDSIRSPHQADISKAEPYVDMMLASLLSGEAVTPKSTQSYGCSIKY